MLKAVLVIGLLFGYSRATAHIEEGAVELMGPECRQLAQRYDITIPREGGRTMVVPVHVALHSQYGRGSNLQPEAFEVFVNGSRFSLSREHHTARGRRIPYLQMRRQTGPVLDSQIGVTQDISVQSKYPQGCRSGQECGRLINICPRTPGEFPCRGRDGKVQINFENVDSPVTITAYSEFREYNRDYERDGVQYRNRGSERRQLGELELNESRLRTLGPRLRRRATPEMQRACMRRAAARPGPRQQPSSR